MNVGEAIKGRRAVRSYKSKSVSREKLERIMNYVRLAPSARNKQDWKFVLVTDEIKKEELCEKGVRQKFVEEAPVIVVGITKHPKYRMSSGIPGGIVNLSIALDHLTLKATEEGLGTCWIGAFDQDKVKEILKIPERFKIVSLMTLGYPARKLEKRKKARKDLEKIISYNEFTD